MSESLAYDFHEALGQYLEYRIGLGLQEPDRQVYLAISASRYDRIKKLMLPRLAMEQFQVSLVTFDVISKTIVQWIKK